ncbi:sugar ABC transporter permease [Clostridium oceanicum]|uniref:Sugar ABC transporter permease n=1 Tax=Clostridium oceanicum TaxID=1543 RepID=A0ABN1JIA1_9CLOT
MKEKGKAVFKCIKPYGYIFPLLILITSFYVLPIIMSFCFSFTKYNIVNPAEFIGIENYKYILKDNTFLVALKNTLLVTIVVVPVQTILSMLLAVWIVSKKSKLANFVRCIMFIPVLSSMILVGIIWRIILNGDGSPLNYIAYNLLGKNIDWLGNPKIALPVLMFIIIWKNIGYFMIMYIAALMDIPRDYYEVADVDGANKFQKFKSITVPLLKPTTIMIVFLGSIWSFQIFDLVYTMTGGGPGMSTTTLVLHIFNLSFKQFNSGYSMAVANILFLIIAIITIVQRKFLKREESIC